MAAELFQEVHQVALCRGKGPEQRDAGRGASGERRGEGEGGQTPAASVALRPSGAAVGPEPSLTLRLPLSTCRSNSIHFPCRIFDKRGDHVPHSILSASRVLTPGVKDPNYPLEMLGN